MARTTIDPLEAPVNAPGGRRHIALLAALGVAVVALVSLAIALWPAGSSAEASELARAQQACRTWVDASPTTATDSWCTDMATWMREQFAQGTLTGPMMWSTPSAMRDTCRRWAEDRDRGTDDSWCDEMVAWMWNHLPSTSWQMPMGGMMGTRAS